MATTAQKLNYAEVSAPSTPATGLVVTYAKADGLMYSKDDAGVETLMSGGSGGGIPATILDAKGDLIAASAADTAAKLTAGANGTVLTAASGETTGLIWTAFSGARVYNSGAINLNNGSYTTLTFDTEHYDIGAYHDTGSNTERLTIATTGKYRFGCGVTFSGLGTGICFVEIVKNAGPTPLAVDSRAGVTGTTTNVTIASEALLTAADYLWVRVYVATGSVTAIRNDDWSVIFWIEKCLGA